MKSSINIANKNALWSLIKTVGHLYGEDDDFLKEYAKDVYETNLADLPRAIECFKILRDEVKWLKLPKVWPKFSRQDVITKE